MNYSFLNSRQKLSNPSHPPCIYDCEINVPSVKLPRKINLDAFEKPQFCHCSSKSSHTFLSTKSRATAIIKNTPKQVNTLQGLDQYSSKQEFFLNTHTSESNFLLSTLLIYYYFIISPKDLSFTHINQEKISQVRQVF